MRALVRLLLCLVVLHAAAHAFATCPVSPPTLTDPADQSVVSPGFVTLKWSSVAGASTYEVWAGLDGDPLGPIGDPTTHIFKVIEVEPGREVEWKVVAYADSCTPLASGHFTFTTSCPNVPPIQLNPPNGTVFPSGTEITFGWNGVPGAASYDFNLSPAGQNDWEIFAELVNGTTFTAVIEDGNWDWQIRANFDGACEPSYSGARSFSVSNNTCESKSAPGLIAPANNATLTSPIAFRWSDVGAKQYRLYAKKDGAEPSLLATTTRTDSIQTLSPGTYEWAVVASFDGCPDKVGEQRIVIVQQTPCSTTPPSIVAPANGATGVASPVELRWSSVPGATRYALFASLGNDEFAFYGETEETSIERFVPQGATIRWFVVAIRRDCPEIRSEIASFQTAGSRCPDAAIAVSSPPENATVNSPVTVAWTSVPDTTAYRVWASRSGESPIVVQKTTATQAAVRLPAGATTLFVEALRDDCPSVVSPERRFTVATAANCDANPAPTLSSPVGTQDAPAQVANPVMLAWNAVPGALGYRVWVGEDGVAYQDVRLTTATSISVTLEPDEWGWFVQALFEGCDSKVSPRAFFVIPHDEDRCNHAAPAIVSPGPGATVTSPVVFTWSAVPDAEKYRVFASLDNGDPLLLGITTDTTIERVLPPGSITWLVEAVFRECPSTLSPRVTFGIPRAQTCDNPPAGLLSPPDGASGLDPEIDFVWSQVEGAVRYALVVRHGDGAWTPIATTQDTHAVRTLPPGHADWSVIAFFPGCDPVEAAHFELGVAAPSGDCDNRKPILLLPSDKSTSLTSPVRFAFIGVPNASGYNVWAWQENEQPSIVATTTGTEVAVDLGPGTYFCFVEAAFDGCRSRRSADVEITVIDSVPCGTPKRPAAQVVGQAQSNTSYRVRWTALPNVDLYELQESTSADFTGAETFTTAATSMPFAKENLTGAPVKYYYRVRGVSNCNDERGAYSPIVGVFIIPPKSTNASAELGASAGIVQSLFLAGSSTPQEFTATADKPWITISPSSGTIPPEGLTLDVTADPRVLAIGTNTGTVSIQYPGAAKNPQTNATTASIPLSVSLVTPVTPSGNGTPPPDSLIFAIVGHAEGANNSLFESDIRLTNLGAQTMKYELHFTPSGVDGTVTGSSSTIEIEPNQTMAIDDIIASFFGTGTTSSATGMLEVRPLTTSASPSNSLFSSVATSAIKELITAASSRTYNFTPTGTFGQFIPATRFDQFIGKVTGAAPAILSLQQVAQSAAFRANFGFAEAAGESAQLSVRVYDAAGTRLKTIPVSLQPREHRQINGMLASNGITDLADGRVEVEVTGGNGKVTTYVSEVDNLTNDPLLVWGIPKGAIVSNRYVVPGAAFIDNGFAFWVTDLRVFNAGATSTPATLTFYPQGNPGAPVVREITLDAGEVAVLDNVVADLFGQSNGAGGAIAITTPADTTLTASARTYNQTSNGTYGQFIPGVTPAQSIGLGDRALQILQLEQSTRFRTNIGLSETSGQAATVEVSAIVPDSLVTAVVSVNLAANEFRQFSLAELGLGSAAYNTRVSVKVIGGNGRVTAYGSAIDQITQDPTYVPAQ